MAGSPLKLLGITIIEAVFIRWNLVASWWGHEQLGQLLLVQPNAELKVHDTEVGVVIHTPISTSNAWVPQFQRPVLEAGGQKRGRSPTACSCSEVKTAWKDEEVFEGHVCVLLTLSQAGTIPLCRASARARKLGRSGYRDSWEAYSSEKGIPEPKATA